jgi:anti-sigma regulatory factor (Ser/Thr protein kinase)
VSESQVPLLTFSLAAVPSSVRRARGWMVAFAQEHTTDHEIHERVALAFTEAFTNAVRHAYDGCDPQDDDISVAADLADGLLEILVVDHGSGFRSQPRTPGLGAGMTIIAECADEFAIRERAPSGTEVWMGFALSPTPPD